MSIKKDMYVPIDTRKETCQRITLGMQRFSIVVSIASGIDVENRILFLVGRMRRHQFRLFLSIPYLLIF